MKLLEAYNQIGKSFKRPTEVRKYENAALQRTDRVPDLQNPDFKATLQQIREQKEKYPTYQIPAREALLPTELEKVSEDAQRSPIQVQQVRDAITAYRKADLLQPLSINDMFQKLLQSPTAAQTVLQKTPEETSEVLERYKRQREDLTKSHERELWDQFDISHMYYIDNGNLAYQLDKKMPGQIIDLRT